MASHNDQDGDKSLLDRLNALKPSSLNLDPSTNSLGIPISSSDGPPESRDDALSARLRTLRNQGDEPGSPKNSASSTAAISIPAPIRAQSPGTQPPAVTASLPRLGLAGESPTPTPPPKPCPPRDSSPTSSSPPGPGEVADEAEDDDPLFLSDDKQLDDLLEGLEDPFLGAEEVGEAGGQEAKLPGLDAQLAEAQRVAALFGNFEKNVSLQLASRHGDAGREGKGGRAAGGKSDGDDGGGAEFDSDGEEIRHEVDNVLLQALDELSLDFAKSSGPGPGPGAPKQKDSSKPGQDVNAGAATAPDTEAVGPFSLPAVPSAPVDPIPGSAGKGQDQGPSAGRRGSLDFEAVMSERLAALKGLGSAPEIDELGMPAAPTFRPEDNLFQKISSTNRKLGYSEDDLKTWCIVCLEDATVRCLGCDDDGYCERCWRSMHVGPSAGYDERGHKRIKFERR